MSTRSLNEPFLVTLNIYVIISSYNFMNIPVGIYFFSFCAVTDYPPLMITYLSCPHRIWLPMGCVQVLRSRTSLTTSYSHTTWTNYKVTAGILDTKKSFTLHSLPHCNHERGTATSGSQQMTNITYYMHYLKYICANSCERCVCERYTLSKHCLLQRYCLTLSQFSLNLLCLVSGSSQTLELWWIC